MTYESNPFSSYLILNKLNTSSKLFSSLQMKKTYFYTRCPLRNRYIFCIPKASYNNEVNFNIYPHTNTKCEFRCKFAKITLRMRYLGCCYFYTKCQIAFHPIKKLGHRFFLPSSVG